jgi:hypothetical protein
MSKEQAARNRAAFPEAARFVDEMRAVFGLDVLLIYAEENGKTIGTPCPDGVMPNIEKRNGASDGRE